MDRGGLSRDEYERFVGDLRENMRDALDAKKKYALGEPDDETDGEAAETNGEAEA